ncbi:MAG: DUF4337 domain-containing protein [Pseudomonadota bacterium]
MEALESHEKIHEAAHGHGHDQGQEHDSSPKRTPCGGRIFEPPNRNKLMALLISILAALLAISETAGKSTQNASLNENIHASDTWAQYQAKKIRMITLETAADNLEAMVPNAGGDLNTAAAKLIKKWRTTSVRYKSEPDTGDGLKELGEKAKAAEGRRDRALAAYHLFEFGSAALQLAIVLASATVVTGAMALAWVSGGLGLLGILLGALGWLAPTALHL